MKNRDKEKRPKEETAKMQSLKIIFVRKFTATLLPLPLFPTTELSSFPSKHSS